MYYNIATHAINKYNNVLQYILQYYGNTITRYNTILYSMEKRLSISSNDSSNSNDNDNHSTNTKLLYDVICCDIVSVYASTSNDNNDNSNNHSGLVYATVYSYMI